MSSVEVKKFMDLCDTLKQLETKKIRLEEQFKNKKEMLTELVREIKAEGYDPNTLKDVIAEKEAELQNEVEAFEKALQTASTELAKAEG